MAKRQFRSKTQWITQPRDKGGRWARIGGVFKSAGAGAVKVGSAISRKTGIESNFSVSLWRSSAQGSASYTKKLPGGFSSTTSVVTRIHRTDNKSPFQSAINKGTDYGLSKISNKRAQGIARAATGVYPTRVAAPLSSITVSSGGVIRSKSNNQVRAEAKRADRKKQKKLRKRAAVVRARAAGSTGQPSTITKGRPARRNSTGLRKPTGSKRSSSITPGVNTKTWR